MAPDEMVVREEGPMDQINTDIGVASVTLVAPGYTADDTDSLRSPHPSGCRIDSTLPAPVDSQSESSALAAMALPTATESSGDDVREEAVDESADAGGADVTDTHVSARQAQKAATRSMKEALITQAELVAMVSPSQTAAAEMKALMAQWKTAGRTTKTEDDALWARFNTARDQLFTRLDLLRQQRRDEMAEAKRAKDALIATAEEVAQRADLRQAAETMTSLMAQWKKVGPAPDDKGLWLRFKAAHDTVYQRRHEQRQTSQVEQRVAAEAKRSLIAEAEGLVGSPDLRAATARLRDMQAAFRETGYAGRDLNRRLADQFHTASQDFYRWMRREPVRRRDSGEQPTYGRRARIVRQISQVKADIDHAEETLRTINSSGAKRSHGSAITLTLGQVGAYSDAAADAMRLKIRLTDLEGQLARLDATLRNDDHSSVSVGQPVPTKESVSPEQAMADDASAVTDKDTSTADQSTPLARDTTPDQPTKDGLGQITDEPESSLSPDPA